MYYMLSKWWLHLLAGLVHYFIRTGVIEQVMVMTNKLIILLYTMTNSGSIFPLT